MSFSPKSFISSSIYSLILEIKRLGDFLHNLSSSDFSLQSNHNYVTDSQLSLIDSITPRLLLSTNTTVTVASSTSLTSVLGTVGIGSKTISSSVFTVGSYLKCGLRGSIACSGTPTLRIKVFLTGVISGVSTLILDSTAFTMTTVTGTCGFNLQFDILCRTSGSSGNLVASGNFDYFTSQTAKSSCQLWNSASISGFDCTKDYIFDVQVQWGTNSSSNSFSCGLSNLTNYKQY